MKRNIIKFIPFFIMASFLVTGCNQDTSSTIAAAKPTATAQAQAPKELVYKGSVVGKSNKAKSISISVGKDADAKTIMVRFDDKTKGVEHASVGHASIIYYEMRDGLPWATVIKPKLAKLPEGVTEIKTDELKALMDAKGAYVLIDARPGKRYAEAHIPGSLNIGTKEYKEKAATVLPKDKNMLLVMYCGGPTCGMSTNVAGQAKKDGYKNIKVYLGGQPGWIKAGNPVYASKGYVEKGNIILVDLRSKKKSEAGRIARSVSIPYDSLDDRLEAIPKKAPVVLYSDSDEEAADALADFREAGYKKVSLVSGNYAGWVKSGGETVQGPVTTDINWKRKLGKGEVGKADFMKAVNGADGSTVILDVRTTDEVSAGAFKNSISVPLDQIATRLSEIPKDKKVYVHCTTGARADMAAQELNKNGYNAFFFVADIDCKGNECKVED